MQFIDFAYNDAGLLPCIVQDYKTKEVLMMAYMDKEALERTFAKGQLVFWSRSRKEYWHKGKTSGNFLIMKEMRYDCDRDTLLALVEPTGPVCHTGSSTCFFRRLD